jgi:hypothetical protein
MEKANLPKDVVDAIEGLRGVFGDSEDLLTNLPLMQERYGIGGDGWYGAIVNYCKVPSQRMNYFKAVVNGYEKERTPEDVLREYYRNLNPDGHVGFDRRAELIEKRASVRHTLNVLGIKIEGVNA